MSETDTKDQLMEAATMCFACGKDNPIGLQIKFLVEVSQENFRSQENFNLALSSF